MTSTQIIQLESTVDQILFATRRGFIGKMIAGVIGAKPAVKAAAKGSLRGDQMTIPKGWSHVGNHIQRNSIGSDVRWGLNDVKKYIGEYGPQASPFNHENAKKRVASLLPKGGVSKTEYGNRVKRANTMLKKRTANSKRLLNVAVGDAITHDSPSILKNAMVRTVKKKMALQKSDNWMRHTQSSHAQRSVEHAVNDAVEKRYIQPSGQDIIGHGISAKLGARLPKHVRKSIGLTKEEKHTMPDGRLFHPREVMHTGDPLGHNWYSARLNEILFAHTPVGGQWGTFSHGRGWTRQGPRHKQNTDFDTFTDSYRKKISDDVRSRRINLKVSPKQAARAETARNLKGFHKIKEAQWKAGMKDEYDAAFTRRAAAADAANAVRSKRLKIGAGAAALVGGGLLVRARMNRRRQDDVTIPR